MRVAGLRIAGLRCLEDVSLELDPGINVFVGANGAGKTSLLEAVFLLSHGRSFRSGARDALVRRGSPGMNVFAEIVHADGMPHKLGLGKEGARWQARLDGAAATLAELVTACAVVSFDPGSHALIAAGAEERRRFVDWGLFHVEQDFLLSWRRYHRSLKQRNALLRSGALDPAGFEPWEIELDQTATAISSWRRAYLARLMPILARHAERLLPELGVADVSYRQGWSEEVSLVEALRQQRARDAARGHTTLGAHRADWSIAFEHAPQREHLSRGQEKLTALACLLAQADLYAEDHQDWPIVCLDDLASELDLAHRQALIEQLRAGQAQVLVTGTELEAALKPCARVFHVEQGTVTPLL